MTRKHANKKDSAENDQEELSALIRSIKLSQKYYLFFVACNQIPRQNELIAEIKVALSTKNIKVINFKEPITNLLNELKQTLKDKSPDAIFVQGLGNSISSDGIGKENALIHSLNLTRDSFNDAFQCPIYLWLPEYAVIKITRNAPDYFSVRSGVFYFSSTAEQVISDIFQSTSSEWLETSSLPLAEKQKRIVMLENLLAEYQNLDEDKRDKQAEMRLYSQMANLFFSISDYKKAIEYYNSILNISKEIKDTHIEGKALGSLGISYESLGNHKKAIEYTKKAINILDKHEDKERISNCIGNLGVIYKNLGNYQEAIKYSEQALKLSREISNEQGESFFLNNLGISYSHLKDYEKATNYYLESLRIKRKLSDLNGEGGTLSNLGNIYINLGDYHRAIEYLEQALAILTQIGNKDFIANTFDNLGNAYFHLGNKIKAKDYYLMSLAIFEAIESANAESVRQHLKLLK